METKRVVLVIVVFALVSVWCGQALAVSGGGSYTLDARPADAGRQFPDIGVSPDSLCADLLTGQTDTQILTIENTGDADLVWGIGIEFEELARAGRPIGFHARERDDTPSSGVLHHSGGGTHESGVRDLGDVLGTYYNFPVSNTGMVWAGDALFVVDYWDGTFHKYDVETQQTVETHAIHSYPYGMTWDGELLWIGEEGGNVYGYDLSGALVGSFSSSVSWPAIAWDGSYFLITDAFSYSAPFYLVDYDGSVVQTFSSSYYGYANALEWVPGHADGEIWVNDNETGRICQLFLETGVVTLVSEFPFYDTDNSFSLSHDGTDMWWSDFDGPLYQIDDGIEERRWLVASPESGIVPAGASAYVDVTFDASGLFGGDYLADVVVSSNDPDEPEVLVPSQLHVTGAPDIAVSDTLLSYGEVFVGTTATDTLVVLNAGTDTLVVGSISADHPAYSAAPTDLVLGPWESSGVIVSFTPGSEEPISGTLTILSNDPDEGTVYVALEGEGLIPPDIGVAPDSLYADLLTGQTDTQILTIENTGGSDLEWGIGIRTDGGDSLRTYVLAVPRPLVAEPDGVGAPAPARRASAVTARLADLTGVQILWDASHGQGGAWEWSAMVADLTARGATITESYDPVTGELLGGYDVLWTIDCSNTWTSGELSALATWVAGGGSLLLEGDNNSSVLAYNAILTALGADITYLEADGASGTTSNIHPHETTEGIASIYLNSPIAHLSSVVAPATVLVDDISSVPNTACSSVGRGRIVAAADELFGDYGVGYADNQLFGNQVFDWLLGVQWLWAEPAEGTLAAGATVDVSVTFDAWGLFGGDYMADFVVGSNDPDEPEVVVPSHLHVTGAPDIAVSDTLLSYGEVFIGTTVTNTLVVLNEGADTLVVSDISSDEPAYSVDVTTFNLNPRESQAVLVSFTPGSVGSMPGTLTILSNDPDEGTMYVALEGEGVEPPDIGVAPDSLYADLLTGQTDTQILTIENTGGSALEWGIGVRASGGGSLRTYVLAVPRPALAEPDGGRGGAPAHARRATTLTARLADLTGVQILWDASHGQGSAWDWSTMVADLSARGATVTESYEPITSELLDGYDVLWTIDCSDTWTSGELSALAPWVAGGGGLLLEGDGYSSVLAYNNILVALGAGITYSEAGGASGTTSNIYPHETTEGVVSVYLGGPMAHLSSVTGPASILVDDISSVPNTACSSVGLGRVVAAADELFGDYGVGYADNQLFGNQVFDWLMGVQWLWAEPAEGTLAAGATVDVSVTFDASGLFGGDYFADLVVGSNDPDEPEVVVPTYLHVTSAPDIAVSDTLLSYGEVFIGLTVSDTLVVLNEGTDTLVVSGISSDEPAYSVDVTTFDLGPRESQAVLVSFTPGSVGSMPGTLTILSNDPDEGTVYVALEGEGVVPPDIGVAPDSLYADLLTGQTDTQILTIENTGGSDLEWGIGVRASGGDSLRTYALAVPPTTVAERDGVGAPAPARRTSALTARLADLTGVQILWDASHGQGGAWSWLTMVADLAARGATVTESYEPITSELLDGYDVLWTIDCSDTWTSGELSALAGWVGGGGGLLLEGDDNSSVGAYNAILTALGAGITYSTTNGTGGTTSGIYPHETTEGVMSVHIGGPVAHLSSVTGAASVLVDDLSSVPNTACSSVGLGRIVAAADELFGDYGVGYADNQLFGNQVFDWLAGPQWMWAEPAEGTVAAGATVDVSIMFDASGLFGGDYFADLVVGSNDPDEPEVLVPSHLHVTGVPDIAVSDTLMSYGEVFIGLTVSDTLVVLNEGTDTLVVSDISSDEPAYSVDVTTFNLNPRESQAVLVSFTPGSVEPISGTLTILSNDPDEGTLYVELTGEGVVPPDVGVTPDSLYVGLFTGQTDTRTLNIANTGGSDLTWAIDTRMAGSGRADRLIGFYADSAPHEIAAVESRYPDRSWTRGLPRDAGDTLATYANFPSPSAGMVWVNDSLYVVGELSLYRYDVEVQQVVETYAIHPSAHGIAWDGDYLWIGRADGNVYGYDLAGTNVGSFSGPVAWPSITWDGGCFVINDASLPSPTFYAVGYDGAAAETYPSSYSGSANGSTWVHMHSDGHLWVNDWSAGRICRLSLQSGVAELVDQIPFSDTGFAYSMAHDGRDLWWSDIDGPLYRIDDGIDEAHHPSADPSSGTIPVGSSENVLVTFDGAGLFGGDYISELVITSNDPDEPEVVVPAVLHVTAAPDIAASDTLLAYGGVFIGLTVTDTLIVSNEGSDDLIVSDINSDQSDYSAAPTSFSVPAGRSHAVLVSFSPSVEGLIPGTLTIASNDPDEGTLYVDLAGGGVVPPDVGVSPDSLYAALLTGQTDTQLLTIENTGASDLEWEIDLRAAGGREFREYALTTPGQPVGEGKKVVAPSAAGTVLKARLADLSGVEILWDRVHSQGSSGGWSTMIADLTARGASVTESYDPVTSEVLGGCDVLWTIDCSDSWTAAELSVLATWVVGGGSLLLEGDNYSSVYAFDDILAAVGAGIDYTTSSGTSGTTENIYPHETTEGVSSIYLSYPDARLYSVVSPASVLIADASSRANTAYSEVGSGRIVAMADELLSDPSVGTADNRLFGNQVFDWLACGWWLSADPVEGTVAAGATVDVSVTLDAGGLPGGDYFADLVIASNDPDESVVVVPAHMQVTAAADIAVSDTLLSYGSVFIGLTVSDTLVVSNEGTEPLAVSNIGSDEGDYWVDVSTFTVTPGENQAVLVSFSPSVEGLIPGTLTITSDDPDEGTLYVDLSGEGVAPPDIGVAPDSLYAALLADQTDTQLVTIENTGASDLVWEAVIVSGGGSYVVSSSGEFIGEGITDEAKESADGPAGRPDEDRLYRSSVGEARGDPELGISGRTGGAREPLTSLEEVLENLDAGYEAVTGAIPNRYDFSDGVTGTYISDGGGDMYDGGNYLRTDYGGWIPYSDGAIQESGYFGVEGRYFTRKYPGLFVLVAEIDAVEYFQIDGDLGADGSGNVDGAVLETVIQGSGFRGYVKRVHGTSDPSVNHLVIVTDEAAADHEFSTSTNNDYHQVFGLGGGRRLYYLLYAGSGGYYIDDASALGIMNAFLEAVDLAPGWLSADPSSGTVAPGGSADVSVTFDAGGLLGGDYLADVVVVSNDPDESEVTVPTHLCVTGIPDIAVSDTLLAYGGVFIGLTVTDTLVVLNEGTDTLAVSDISSDEGDYLVDVTAFDLAPGESHAVLVSFSPSVEGLIPGTLTITSDDPDEGTLYVDLAGGGVVPPDVGVSPDSLYAALLTGQADTQLLTIANTGGSALEWEIDLRAAGGREFREYALTTPGQPVGEGKRAVASSAAGTVLTARLANLSGVEILWDRAHYQGVSGGWSTMIADLTARGASVTESYDPVTSELLGGYDILWTIDCYDSWTAAELSALAVWVAGGGSLLLEGDYNSSVYAFDDILVAVGAGIDYTTSNGTSGTTENIYPHETTEGIGSIYLEYPGAYLYSVVSPASVLIADASSRANTAYSEVGSGRIVAMADQVLSDPSVGTADNRLFGNQVFDWLAGGWWLSADPVEGTVAAGATVDVSVTFDAGGRVGGDYFADLVIASNDPDESVVVVPAHMQVTAAADIAVSDTLLSYGGVFVGLTVSDTLVVSNEGTEPLAVSDVSSDESDYSVDVTIFDLAPGESHAVLVSFSPSVEGLIPGTLTITSDDPDEGTLYVDLSGEGVAPPDIGVAPDSLYADVPADDTETQILTIENTGASDLEWAIDVRGTGGDSLREYILTIPRPVPAGPELAGAEVPAPERRSGAIRARLANLSGVDVLWDRAHGQSDTGSWSVMIADLTARGASVTESYDPVTSEVLGGCDILWTIDCSDSWTAAELSALAVWVADGGSLLLEGDYYYSVYAFDDILAAVGAGIDYTTSNGTSGTTENIYPHETTEGVSSIYLSYPDAYLYSVVSPASVLIEDSSSRANTAYSEVGSGRIIAMADQVLSDPSVGTADNQLFGNQVFDWLAGLRWVWADPWEGTVAAGAAVDVSVTFDAGGLLGGDYFAEVVVGSNDPDESEVVVPTHLHVTGAPDIAVSDTLMSYGSVFIGLTVSDTLVVMNEGTDTLAVSDVSSDESDYSVDVTIFDLAPGESHAVLVSFSPSVEGLIPGTLTITSDDPDEGTLYVDLSGEGVVPPDVGVSPDSLYAALLTGQTDTQLLTIANTGASDLEWEIDLRAAGGREFRDYVLTIPDPPSDEGKKTVASSSVGAGLRARLADLSGVEILWDRAHSQGSSGGWSTMIADLTARGASVTESYDPVTSEVLGGYDILWTIDCYDTWTAAELSALAVWVADGGSLLLEGDYYYSVYAFDDILAAIGAGIDYTTLSGTSGTTENIYPHETTEGVGSIYLEYPDARLYSVVSPASVLIEDVSFMANTAYSEVGSGRIVAMADQVLSDNSVSLADNQLFGNRVFDWLAGGWWLSADPVEGTVAAGATVDVSVTFDAGGRVGGDYFADLVIASNDPDESVVVVPAHMQVTAAADIAVSDTLLSYGSVFVGLTVSDTLVVSNEGTELLAVTDVSSDESDYSVDVSTFTVDPGESHTVLVSFSPSVEGLIPGTLTITSDDPDEGTLSVELSGEGVAPPDIGVAPDSLYADLLSGATETQVVTIANSGTSDLVWEIDLRASGEARAGEHDLAGLGGSLGRAGVVGARIPIPLSAGTAFKGRSADLSGVEILWDRAHGQSDTGNWSVIIADLTARGATVVENFDPITNELLIGCDVFWTTDCSDTWTAAEVMAIAYWVSFGGSLLLEGDYYYSVYAFDDILTAVGAGIDYTTSNGTSGTTENIYPHETTEGVGSIYLENPDAHLYSVVSPASVLIEDSSSRANTAYSEVGSGRIVAMADELLWNYSVGTADNQLFGNQVFDWLAGGWWLSADPVEGTVAAGATVDVSVTFDAGDLLGGDYFAEVVVVSNDPDEPEIAIPAHLHVTGIPDIAVSDALLSYGGVFIGLTISDTLVVLNEGTDTLAVSDVSSDESDYSVDVTAFDLAPGESQAVLVSFSPSVEGLIPGTLTITSNDPDEGTLYVDLSGEGVAPPDIGVAPDSLYVALLTGQTDTQILTIENTGASDLEWEIDLRAAGGREFRDYAFTASGPPVGEGKKVVASSPAGTVLRARLADLSGVEILWDRAHSQGSSGGWSTMIADLTARGASVTESYDPVTSEVLGGCDILWTMDCSDTWTAAELSALAVWVADGGSFLLEGDYYYSVYAFDDILTAVGAGIDYTTSNGTSGATENIYPHETTEGVSSIYLSSPDAYLYSVVSPASVLIADASSRANTAYSEVGSGRIVAMADELLGNPSVGAADNRLFGNQVFDWLAGGWWLSADPVEGTVAAGATVDVSVTFDAGGLVGGDYFAELVVGSNDPDESVVVVPAHMQVTGAPDIAVSDTLLAFGEVQVGFTVTETLEVFNVGTNDLTVSAITTDHPDYWIDVSAFVLVPGQSRGVAVNFAPSDEGVAVGTLTITSDDPDESVVEVALEGEGSMAHVWRVPGDAPTIGAGIDSAAAGDVVLVAPGTYAGERNRGLDFGGKEIAVISEAGAESTIIDCGEQDRGFRFSSGESSEATVRGFTIVNGRADMGGAIYVHGSSPTITDCVFSGNGAGGGGGGAIYCADGSSPTIRDCGFYENTSDDRGGAIRSSFASPSISNCTLVYNGAPLGGGVACNGSTFTIANSVVAFNVGGGAILCEGGVGIPSISHSCIFANAGGDSLCGNYHDNLFVDPLFCGMAQGNLTLCENSPCLPSGSPWGNPWGELIGAYGQGCGSCDSPVEISFYAVLSASGTVTLRWTVSDLSFIDGFDIYRGTSSTGPFAKINEQMLLAASPGEYEDGTVWPGTTFWYQLMTVPGDSEGAVVESPVSVAIPGRLAAALHAPQPNPFRGETSVEFDVPPDAGRVKVTVYNIRGQLVRVLFEGAPGSGRYVALWDGRDLRGTSASSGVYFMMLEAGTSVKTRKLLLVK